MSYVSHTAGPTRLFDHIYDPLYKVSSQKDVSKANIEAIDKSAPIQIVSIYPTMFSDMSYRPSHEYWKRQNRLPHLANSNAVVIYNKKSDVEKNSRVGIEGTRRCNYFYYPRDCVKTLNLSLNLPIQCQCMETPRAEYQTVGCQTIYRESSAQTRPYLPDYYLANQEADTPEIVKIANVIPGDLKPGETEAEIIERNRKRRLYQKGVHQLKSLKEWSEWRTILEAFEWEEFLVREKDILESQNARLEYVKKLMKNREMRMRENSATTIEHEFLKIEREKNLKLEKLVRKLNREIRKLEFVRKNIPRRYKAENVVKEHIDQASDLYAPRMRFGIHPKRQHFQPFNTLISARLEGMEKKCIDEKRYKCAVKSFDRLSKPKGPVTEIIKGFSDDEHLTKLYGSMKKLGDTIKTNKERVQCKGMMRHDRHSSPKGNDDQLEDTLSNNEVKHPAALNV